MTFSLGEWQELRTGVHRMVAEPASINIGLVVGSEAAVLIDCGSAPDQGREIARSAAERAGRPLTHIVITHDHWDHFWGLAGVVDEFPEIVSIAHESVTPPAADDEASLPWAKELGVDLATLAAPNTTLSLAKGINVGDGVRVEAVHLGPAHTPGDVVVVVQGANVRFTGDVYETADAPCFMPNSNVENWPSVLDIALAGADDDSLIVPGHGDPTGPFPAFQQRAEVSMIYGAAERLVARGVRLDDALAALEKPLNDDGSVNPNALEWEWPFTPETIKAALPLAYAELKGHGAEPKRHLPLV